MDSSVAGAIIITGGFLLARLVLALAMPLFRRYAMARPNARSSHHVPTPQGGGFGILIGGLGIGLPASLHLGTAQHGLWAIAGLALAMGLLGAFDDLRPLGWRFRLIAQGAIIIAMLAALPAHLRVVEDIPLITERAAALVLGLWFVNLTNFMDGIDGILVAGLAPLFLAIGTGFLGLLPLQPLALALFGALIGFLALNFPPARLFAGDVGALALGFLAAVLLFTLAAKTSLAAAIILPLYFAGDASITLLARIRRRARLTEAHREHAYQNALDNGMPCRRIIGEIVALNIGLALLAGLAIRFPLFVAPLLACAVLLVALLIARFRGIGP